MAGSAAQFFTDDDFNYDALPGRKTLVEFTASEGANRHCEVKAPGLRAQRMFDWLDTTLERGRRPENVTSGWQRP